MRSYLSRGLWLVVFLVPALVGLLRGEQEKDGPADPIQILVKQLGSEVFATRIDASKKLIALGEKAVPALLKAGAKGDDLEVRRRACALVLAILPPERKSITTGMELVLLEGGDFQMGSPINEKNRRPDEHGHGVTIKVPYYAGKHEVTQGEYQKVMDANPSWFTNMGGGRDHIGAQDTGRFPVENVTWFDAIEFCNKLSKRDDVPPYYQLTDVKREGGSIRSAKVTIAGGNGYRLLTEAEWEFACRAHVDGPYHFARNPNGRDANFKSSIVAGGYGAGPLWQPLNRTERVSTYPPNGRGLFDMHGNVAEWCWDYYDKDYYVNSPAADPQGPNTGIHRVTRGGSWLVTEGSSRSASRFMQIPGEANYSTGFRVARNP